MTSELVTLNPEQLKAFRAFKKAVKKCEAANIQFYTNLETIFLLNGDILNTVGDDFNDPEISTVVDLSNYVMNTGFSGWADDTHTVTIK